MIYITGDTHGKFSHIVSFCETQHTTPSDTLIILGDAGINYYASKRDRKLKQTLAQLPVTLFCIHGNHEQRPHTIPSYQLENWNCGQVYTEKEYPNILFAKDGEIFRLDGSECIVIGGAYSVDKYYRLERGTAWWPDEQPSDETKAFVEEQLAERKNSIDIILSHTCPLKYEPQEVFLPFIDQSMVDKTTEQWLDRLEDRITYKKWYCGHYHIQKRIDRIQFLFESIEVFSAI